MILEQDSETKLPPLTQKEKPWPQIQQRLLADGHVQTHSIHPGHLHTHFDALSQFAENL